MLTTDQVWYLSRPVPRHLQRVLQVIQATGLSCAFLRLPLRATLALFWHREPCRSRCDAGTGVRGHHRHAGQWKQRGGAMALDAINIFRPYAGA